MFQVLGTASPYIILSFCPQKMSGSCHPVRKHWYSRLIRLHDDAQMKSYSTSSLLLNFHFHGKKSRLSASKWLQ